jgi:pimeloyl-ACP methyl ester carboxylesterase
VILLHGWPYDIHSYVDVAPMLAAKGYRVIVPHLRGYGTTRFLQRARRDTPSCATASRRRSPSTSSR